MDELGEDNIISGSDFPHPDGVWPDSQEYIQRELGHLPDATRKKILCDNAAKLYRLSTKAGRPRPLGGDCSQPSGRRRASASGPEGSTNGVNIETLPDGRHAWQAAGFGLLCVTGAEADPQA